MKILWMSDSPTSPTELGTVTGAVCAGLADYGHQVSILGWQTQSQQRWHQCTLYPLYLQHNPTIEEIARYLRRLQPDIFVMLGELRWFPQYTHPIIAEYLRTAGIAWTLYYSISKEPSDGHLLPPWINLLKTVDLPIAMSRYGVAMSQMNGVQPAYIPLGVDTKVFHPPANKEQAKQALGYDGRFVVFTDVSYHPKQVHRALEIFTLEIFRCFAAGKDDVLLHLHYGPQGPQVHEPGHSFSLQAEIAALNLTNKVRLTPDMSSGLELPELANIYQAADVHLLASVGEGVGLPTLQAAATGVVPLAADYAASRELILDYGEALQVQRYGPDQFGLRRAFINIDDAVSKLEQLYRDRERLAAKAERAQCFALGYDWGRIVREWHNLLQHQALSGVKYPWLRIGSTAGKMAPTGI